MRQAPAPQAICQRTNPEISIQWHIYANWLWRICRPVQRQCSIHVGTRCGCTCAAILAVPVLRTAPPGVPVSNGYTVVVLANVTAGGYRSVDTVRTRHTHCPNTFKTSEMNFISILPLEMALGTCAKHPPPKLYFNGQILIY